MPRAGRKQQLPVLRWSNDREHDLGISSLLRKRLVHQVGVGHNRFLYVDELDGVLPFGPDGVGDDADGERVLSQMLIGRSSSTLLWKIDKERTLMKV